MISRSEPAAVPDVLFRPGEPERIPFFSQAATFQRLWPLIRAGVEQVFENGKFSHGKQVEECELRLAEYTGARFVVGVNSGTDALVLLLRACGLRPGDGVLVPAYSFVATATSVCLAGGRPEFVDIDPRRYALDPGLVPQAVSTRSRFVMPAHLFERMADMPAINEVAGRHGLTVVEDSAEGIGMRWAGVHSGLHGAGGVLSFFPSKTLGAIGDAGAVLTQNPRIAELVSALRHHGRQGRTLNHFPGISNATAMPGMNSKMDDIQAAILLAKLTCLDADIARRGDLAEAYRRRLENIPGIIRLPESGSPDFEGVVYVYLIEVERRDELAEYLGEQGIETEIYYPIPLPLQPCFAELGYTKGDFPNAEAVCAHALALPFYPDLTLSEVDRTCDAIRAFFTGSSA